ncbi:cation diffusion facilitator family transporter [Pandoraea sp.]|uniref:cation diffusion facilitator family transporter n=1 Tax=Pandoraea sp. TaxID=1883445 RepID=UPI001205B2F4|nr:cation diffusion facilitator family transporter [Pandoraea sp.]TAL53156.1 MAG: cation diffusion facilitator family transporter [Pandoraea sp.]TAM20637.1 MAG: cation diffusion facilitator family transporter [Pandoraea sp.]
MSHPHHPDNARSAPHDHEHGAHGHDHAGHNHTGHSHAGHSHAGHDHLHGVADQRRIGWAFVIIAAFMCVEIAGGLLSGSLALLADAGHMVSDAAALGFSWLAIHYGRRPATAQLSYGYKRLEILAAFVNGCALFVIAAWIVIEAIQRFAAPVPVVGRTMLIVALVGLAANIAAFLVLHAGNRENLNLRGAWLHVMGDMLGSAAAIVAAGVILATGWTPIDPLLSIFVAVIILKSAWGIVKSSAHILLEGTPSGMSLADIKADLERHVPEVADAHHIHAWSITGERHMLTLHVHPAPGAASREVVAAVQRRLTERFNIEHVTVQVEEDTCFDASVDEGGQAGRKCH